MSGVSSPRIGRRSAARLAAVQALYQIELCGAKPEAVIAEFVKHRLGREIDGDNYGEVDAELFADIVAGTAARGEALDRAISAALTPTGRSRGSRRCCAPSFAPAPMS